MCQKEQWFETEEPIYLSKQCQLEEEETRLIIVFLLFHFSPRNHWQCRHPFGTQKNLFQTKDRPTSFSHYLVNYCFLCDPIGWSFRQARIPRSALSGKGSLWILKTKIRKKLGTNNCNMLIQQQKAIFKENTVVEKENQVGF